MRLPRKLEHVSRKLTTEVGVDANAGVAVIFRMNLGKLELLLVKRAVIPGDPWSGDMAFPGGKKGVQDEDIMGTVSREVLEETGIDVRNNCYLGMMPPVDSTMRQDISVVPLVFVLEKTPEVKINEELSSYHWTEFDKLKWRRGRSLVKDNDVPVFDVGDERVWGLTYRMLEKLLKLAEE